MSIATRGLEGKPVPVRYQLVIDCADPDRMARFWAAALGYEFAPAPDGFATWNDFYRHLGVPEGELVDGADRISDPAGGTGPLGEEGLDHYAVGMKDPEGNEFDINWRRR